VEYDGILQLSIQDATLVTACMNREGHLQRSLARWLELAFIREIIIVDWSNSRPLLDLPDVDVRIRVLRVVDEPRWVLSYAFNLGVSHASHEIVIKCDADAIPGCEIQNCEPGQSRFFAGNWRTGRAAGMASVNGQCIFLKEQFTRVNGYSEFFRFYGRDDEDFYERLINSGCARREIPPSAFEMIDHTSGDRLENQISIESDDSIDRFLASSPAFFEMQNSYIGKNLPWDSRYPRARYETIGSLPRARVLRRRVDLELAVPPVISGEARKFATRCVAKGLLKIPDDKFAGLEEDACRDLIAKWMSLSSYAANK
jgi:glycosyltransferase involved in cell wall biosynthesis